MQLQLKWIGTALFATALIGCGGGNGDAANDAPLAITSGNAAAIAGNAISAVGVSSEGGDAARSSVIGVMVEGSSHGFDLVAFTQDLLIRLSDPEDRVFEETASPLGVEVITLVKQCSPAGIRSLRLVEVGPDKKGVLSTGDTATLSFNACDLAGGRLSGNIGISNLTISGVPGKAGTNWKLQATLFFRDFLRVDKGVSSRIDGGMNFSAAATTSFEASSITADRLSLVARGASLQLADFSMDNTTRLSNMEKMQKAVGTLQIDTPTALRGLVSLVTKERLQTLEGDDYPSRGKLKITGADNSSVTLDVLSNQDVRLEIDSDGDGAMDTMADKTWTELASA